MIKAWFEKLVQPKEDKTVVAVLADSLGRLRIVSDVTKFEEGDGIAASTDTPFPVTNELFEQLLIEIKILNLHMSIVTGEDITEADIT